ncbi:MAG: hypothetical protein JST89_22355 [Cyanobacteria bacterium SZAS-4]|nr:hypothetical protein [Cyanobacteria bacterium SZAS-4]
MKKKKAGTTKILVTATTKLLRTVSGQSKFSCLLAIVCLNLSSVSASEKPDLSISLSTNKTIYHKGDEVVFTETIKNISKNTVQLIDDQCGYGSDMKVMRVSDHSQCSRIECSAGHTLKPGLRPGVRKFLTANESFTRKFSAYITDDLHLAFQNHGTTGFTGFSAGATKAKNLPEKYFGCGQVFDLGKVGHYQVTATYSNSGDWSTGSIHPPMPLWQGSAHSNTADVQVAD